MDKYFAHLLEKFQTSIDALNASQAQLCFLVAIRDFKTEEITLDQLIWVASQLSFLHKIYKSENDLELLSALTACSEIPFYLHRIPETDKDGSITLNMIRETMQYFQKYQHLISNISRY
jgi:hypothetical protein